MGVEDVQAAATVAYGRMVQPHLTLDNQGLASVSINPVLYSLLQFSVSLHMLFSHFSTYMCNAALELSLFCILQFNFQFFSTCCHNS